MVARKSMLTAALAGVMVLGLAGCGDSDDNGKKTPSSDQSVQQTPSDQSTEEQTEASGSLQGLSAQQVAEKATEAMKSANSMRMTGQMTVDGDQMQLDAALSKGGNCEATMSLNGGTAQIMSADGTVYMKGDESFWQSQASSEAEAEQLVQLLKGRWLRTSDTEGFSALCDLNEMLADVNTDNMGDATLGAPGNVDGQKTVTVVNQEDDGGTATTHVADSAKPYIVKMTKSGGSEPGEMAFSDFDKPFEVRPPAPEDVTDLDDLQ